jgi:membrane-associated progesterone receptor component
MTLPSFGQLALYGLTLTLPLILYHHLTANPKPAAKPASTPQGDKDEKKNTTMMQPERTDLDPPKDDPFTQEQLKAYDGTDASKPVYVAIKGTVIHLQ